MQRIEHDCIRYCAAVLTGLGFTRLPGPLVFHRDATTPLQAHQSRQVFDLSDWEGYKAGMSVRAEDDCDLGDDPDEDAILGAALIRLRFDHEPS